MDRKVGFSTERFRIAAMAGLFRLELYAELGGSAWGGVRGGGKVALEEACLHPYGEEIKVGDQVTDKACAGGN